MFLLVFDRKNEDTFNQIKSITNDKVISDKQFSYKL